MPFSGAHSLRMIVQFGMDGSIYPLIKLRIMLHRTGIPLSLGYRRDPQPKMPCLRLHNLRHQLIKDYLLQEVIVQRMRIAVPFFSWQHALTWPGKHVLLQDMRLSHALLENNNAQLFLLLRAEKGHADLYQGTTNAYSDSSPLIPLSNVKKKDMLRTSTHGSFIMFIIEFVLNRRAVRLQEDPSDWLTDIIQTWDPLLLPEEDIVVRLVRPQPPCTRFQCVLAHLIVEQSSAPDHVAGIISTWQPEDFVTPLRHSAFSLFHLLNHQAVLNIAGLRDVCRRTTCNVRLGELPFGLFDWEPVEPGRCLVVHVRPISTAASSSDNFEDWNSLLQQTDIQVDETSLMARRPFFRRPSSSSPSYTSSSTSSTPDWRQTVIFLLDGRTMSANLSWHDSTEMLRLTAQAADLPLSLVMRTHMISHRPPDFIQMDLQGLLLQQSTEFRPTPYLRLVLLDLELHLANDVQPTPFVRRARWLPFATSRQALFRTLGLAAVHQEHRTQCHLWQNNVLIDPRDETQLHLADGDYLKIFVGEAEQNDDCISAEDDIIDVSEHTVTSSSDTDVSVFLQRQLTEFRQSCDHCHHHLGSVPQRAQFHPGLKRHAIDINTASGNCESFTFDATAPAFVPAAERLSNMPTVIQDLYEHWNQVAFAWEE